MPDKFLCMIFPLIMITSIFNIGCSKKDRNQVSEKKSTEYVVETGDTVSLEYTEGIETGQQFGSSSESGPLVFVAGAGNAMPGIEKAVLGMKLNQEKRIVVNPGDAYGFYNKKLIGQMPKTNFPSDYEFIKGKPVNIRNKEGKELTGIITAINEDTIELDLNHPLAGKILIINLKIIDIKKKNIEIRSD